MQAPVFGVHMHAPVSNPKHAFNGLSFVHPERLTTPQLMDLLAANNVKVNGVSKPAMS
jgi:hypothetical protein